MEKDWDFLDYLAIESVYKTGLNDMSHTDFITPFTVEETRSWPDDKLPEPRINVELFTELLLKRWPHTSKPSKQAVANNVLSLCLCFSDKSRGLSI